MHNMPPRTAALPTSFNELIQPFIEAVAAGTIETYNEFSLQHELGFYLRRLFPDDNVQFERNVRFFFRTVSHFIKREIDIAVFSRDKNELKWAIELKFPRNGQHPEQMFSFCKDIMFAEQLKATGFAQAGLLIFADDELFWRGSADGIYGFFRNRNPLHGLVQKPTGAKDGQVELSGSYTVDWRNVTGPLRYAIIQAA